MAENLVQLQLDLSAEVYAALQQRAEQSGLTVAEQIQTAVEDFLRRADEADKEPLDLGNLFEIIEALENDHPGGPTDLAENHDKYLYSDPHGEQGSLHRVAPPPVEAKPLPVALERRAIYRAKTKKTNKRKGKRA
jgi:hypothetical protein